MREHLSGISVVAVAVAIPLIWFVPLAAEHNAGATFSQFLGSAALIIMAISMLISTRLPGLSLLFGPLDRAYVLHKWLGIVAMAAILLHDTIDAEIDGLGEETLLVGLGDTLGELSLYGLLALVLFSIATFTPYKLWKWSHRFIGAFFVAAALHFLLIIKPFAMTDPPGMYVGLFCITGISAYAYATVTGMFSRGRPYKVISAEKNGDALAIELKSHKRKMKAKAGQFAFLSIDNMPEPHPFTLSKISEDGNLRFTIKDLGDYTRSVQSHIKPGMDVRIKGPYGGFTRSTGSPEIWIAAGVGITPFIAWAHQLKQSETPVHLFYSVRQKSNASHLDELTEISKHSSLQLHLHETGSLGRLSAEKIIQTVGDELSNATVSFCGPEQMRDALKKSFVASGLRPYKFHFENFELRSGIGFRKLVSWLLKRWEARAELKGRSKA